MQNSSIWPIDATSLGQSGPWSEGNEEVLCIPQSSSITEAIRLFSVIEAISVIFRTLVGGVLPLCKDAVSVFYSPSWQGQYQ